MVPKPRGAVTSCHADWLWLARDLDSFAVDDDSLPRGTRSDPGRRGCRNAYCGNAFGNAEQGRVHRGRRYFRDRSLFDDKLFVWQHARVGDEFDGTDWRSAKAGNFTEGAGALARVAGRARTEAHAAKGGSEPADWTETGASAIGRQRGGSE